jgi:hypothetical protein
VEATALQLDPTQRSVESRDFEAELRRRIVGQDEAVQAVVDLYQVGAANSEWPPEFFDEELMRTERHTIHDQAIVQVGHQVVLAGWSRSITCTEMMRAGFIILNQALILASSIFSG